MSGAAGHVEVPELTSIGRRGPELQGMWQRMDARPAYCLDLKLVCGIPGLQGTDNSKEDIKFTIVRDSIKKKLEAS
jgi:hypothetical protein